MMSVAEHPVSPPHVVCDAAKVFSSATTSVDVTATVHLSDVETTPTASSQEHTVMTADFGSFPAAAAPVVLTNPSEGHMATECTTSDASKTPTPPCPEHPSPPLPPPISKDRLVAASCFPIHSSYVIKEKIGQGTWGSVHLAIERTSGLERAVKKIPKRFTNDLARFRQEIMFLKGLDHPNIVRLHETFEDYANIYMVMEYCRGGELFDRVTNASYFSEGTAARLAHQILAAVHYIHGKNIVHRDLKPENFLFLSHRATSPMKLIDFGLAKRFSARRQLRTKVGTLYYVSPQVLKGAYNEKCDVWSVGVILHLLLSGAPPFNGPTDACIINAIREGEVHFTGKIWKRVSPLAKDLVRQLLQRDEEKRPSAKEALAHEWFRLFSPTTLTEMCLPRPTSMPARLHGLPSEHELNQTSLLVEETPFSHLVSATAPQTSASQCPTGCCELSMLGIHSPLCSSKVIKSAMPVSHCNATPTHMVHYGDSLTASPQVTTSSGGVSFADHPGVVTSSFTDVLQSQRPLQESTTHPGLNSINKNHLEVWKNLSRSLVPRWRRFAMHSQLKRAALRVIAQQIYDGDEDIQPLRELFVALDSKNDGALSSDELFTGLEVLQRVVEHDDNRNRVVDLTTEGGHILDSTHSNHVAQPSSLQQPLSVPSSADCCQSHDQYCQDDSRDNQGPQCQPACCLSPRHGLSTVKAQFPSSISAASFFMDGGDVSQTGESRRNSFVEDGNGAERVSAEEYQQLVNAVSLDGGDVLEYSDFMAATLEQKQYLRDDVLKAAFRVFDRDGDGRINTSELRASLGWNEVYNPDSALYGRLNTTVSKAVIDKELQHIMETWDRDKDGSIGYDDFVKSIRADSSNDEPNPEPVCMAHSVPPVEKTC